jgi:hypothetical protein
MNFASRSVRSMWQAYLHWSQLGYEPWRARHPRSVSRASSVTRRAPCPSC